MWYPELHLSYSNVCDPNLPHLVKHGQLIPACKVRITSRVSCSCRQSQSEQKHYSYRSSLLTILRLIYEFVFKAAFRTFLLSKPPRTGLPGGIGSWWSLSLLHPQPRSLDAPNRSGSFPPYRVKLVASHVVFSSFS